MEWDCGIFLLPHATIKVRVSEKQGKGDYIISTLQMKTTTLYYIELGDCQYKYHITRQVFNLIFWFPLFAHGQLKLLSNIMKKLCMCFSNLYEISMMSNFVIAW